MGDPQPDSNPTTKPLVVLLHAYRSNKSELRFVESVVRKTFPDAQILIPSLPLTMFSTVSADHVVKTILHHIDRAWGTGGIYSQIILVGHSLGSLFARQAYIVACGSPEQLPLKEGQQGPRAVKQRTDPRPWAGEVDRIVQLAGMNNGWSIDHHMSLSRAFMLSVGTLVAWLINRITQRWPIIMAARRGSPFLAQLRVEWLILRRTAQQTGLGKTPVVQLLGTIDDLVSPHDNIDLITGQDFYFLDVPHSGHENVIEMDGTPEGEARQKELRRALTLTTQELEAESVPPGDITPVPPDPTIKDVVFVMHGIRDEGFWTEKIARAIVQEARAKDRVFARETSTYGFFGMFPFLMSWERHRKVEWLMDRYAEVIARYPEAERIHYVGHSNGTYLLARALEAYPFCHFDRVVFAGSVVPTKYDWSTYTGSNPRRVREVLNYAATADWVVAWFPGLFESLHLSDLGVAGFRGFAQNRDTGHPAVTNIKYVVGSHSAALQENNWRAIARFVVNGLQQELNYESDLCGVKLNQSQKRRVSLPARCPLCVWLFLFFMLLVPPLLLSYTLYVGAISEWLATVAIIGYGALILYVGNRL